MNEKPNGKGLREFLRWEAARERGPEDHPGEWLKALALVLFFFILTCALGVWDL